MIAAAMIVVTTRLLYPLLKGTGEEWTIKHHWIKRDIMMAPDLRYNPGHCLQRSREHSCVEMFQSRLSQNGMHGNHPTTPHNGSKNQFNKSPAGSRPQTPPNGKYHGGYDHSPNSKSPGISRANTPPHGIKAGPHSRAQSPQNRSNQGHPYAKNGSKYGNETPVRLYEHFFIVLVKSIISISFKIKH